MTDETAADPLLVAARAGDREALEALLARHQGQLYRFGMAMCGDPEDAKDVLQDTMLAMARGIRDFRGESSISTWLYTVARSYCIKKRRRQKHAPSELQSLDEGAARLPDPGATPDEALAKQEVARALERAIAALEPDYREVLVLRDVEGLPAKEVAEVLQLSVPAVKSRLHRARLAVREQVAPFLETPDDTRRSAPAPGTCPDVLTLFSQHVEDEISRELCAEMERHLEGCPRCRHACDSLKQTLALCRTSAPSVEVPNSVQASVKTALRSFLSEKV